MLSCPEDVAEIPVVARLCGGEYCNQSKDEYGGMHFEESLRGTSDIELKYDKMGTSEWLEDELDVTVSLLTGSHYHAFHNHVVLMQVQVEKEEGRIGPQSSISAGSDSPPGKCRSVALAEYLV